MGKKGLKTRIGGGGGGGQLSEGDGGEHGAQTLDDVGRHEDVDLLLQVALGILAADVLDGQLFGRHLLLVVERLVVGLGQFEHVAHRRLVEAAVLLVLGQRQALRPRLLVQVPQHLLLQFVLAVVDAGQPVKNQINTKRWFLAVQCN